nr:uncharacterized protein LOC128694174 [Cherax quadricarinatus]
MSPCGRELVVGGLTGDSVGVVLWWAWPLVKQAPPLVVMTGHLVHQLQFSAEGNYLGVLSTRQSLGTKPRCGDKLSECLDKSDDERRTPEDSIKVFEMTERSQTPGSGVENAAQTMEEEEEEVMLELSIWRWSSGYLETTTTGDADEARRDPQQVAMTSLSQLRAEQVTRMSLARGIPRGVVAAMLAVEEEVQVWVVEGGPLGDRFVCHTVGFGLLPPDTVHTMWCLAPDASNTGVVYGVWEDEWVARTLHQGPSGRVTGVAIAPTHAHVATTTHHRYLQVTPLPQPGASEDIERVTESVCASPQPGAPVEDVTVGGSRRVQVPTSLTKAEVKGSPCCVVWATCQVTGEDDLVVVGLEDGSVNMFVLHIAPRTREKHLTLVQVERPHESAILHISTSKKAKPGEGGITPLLVTAGEDRRVFIFRLIRVGKITKLDPIGFHQLDSVPERIDVKGETIQIEMTDGVVLEIPCHPCTSSATARSASSTATPSISSARASGPRETWESVRVVRRQLLQEAAYTCSHPQHNLLLTLPSPDGETVIGVTCVGRLVHIHHSQKNYSVRVSGRRLASPTSDRTCNCTPRLQNNILQKGVRSRAGLRHGLEGLQPRVLCQLEGLQRFFVLRSVSDDGTWAAAWVAGGDLYLYRARGASFPLPQETQTQLRHLVSVSTTDTAASLGECEHNRHSCVTWNNNNVVEGVRGVGVSGRRPAWSSEHRRRQLTVVGQPWRTKRRFSSRSSPNLSGTSKTNSKLNLTLDIRLQLKLGMLTFYLKSLKRKDFSVFVGYVQPMKLTEAEHCWRNCRCAPHHYLGSSPQHTTSNMNQVVASSSRELELLEVLLEKLKTLYSWNPLVSVPYVRFLSSEEVLSAVDTSEEVFTLLSRLAQIRQGREDAGTEEGAAFQSHVVMQVRQLLEYWLQVIRAGSGVPKEVDEPHPRDGSAEGDRQQGQAGQHQPTTEGRQPGVARLTTPTSAHSPLSFEGDTSEEGEDGDSLAALQTQVREVVDRLGSTVRGGTDVTSESKLDVGGDIKWRRLALKRLQQYRATELARSAQLTAYKSEHTIPLRENGEHETGDDQRDQEIEDEITVPPSSITVEQVETQLWHLLGKVELEGGKVKVKVQEAAAAQQHLLHQVNQYRAEWAHPSLTLQNLQHHLDVQVTDGLVNEFYCDALELEESGEVGSPGEGVRRGGDSDVSGGGGSSGQRATTSRRAKVSSGAAIPTSRKPDSERMVPPLSLCGSPRAARTGKTLHTTRDSRTTASTTPHTTKTQRSGRGRRSVRETPKPPPAPRPCLTLSQVQQIQRARTTYLTLLTQVPEPLQQAAQEVEDILHKCEQQVVVERGRLAWAVLRAGQLVRAVGVRVKYRDTERKLREALKERINEQQEVKHKVVAIRQRLEEYEREQESLTHLEEEVDRAFTYLLTDNAQFESQLTRYYESCPTPGLARPHSATSSSGESEGGEDGGGDSGGDDDSGLGTDEARMEGSGPRPQGCDPAVFSSVTLLRDLRWRVAGAMERSRREKTLEERRHAAVLRRLLRTNHVAHSALTALTTMQSEREADLGAIPSVVWLRRSQTSGDLTSVTRLPIPNTEVDSMAAVKWMSDGTGSEATLLTRQHLQQLEQRVAQAREAQELAARRHREGRAERRALTQQVEQLKMELNSLQHTYQVTKECKFGLGAEADMGVVQDKLGTSLELRWTGKVASQMTRHDNTMSQLQADITGRRKEVQALQKEEAALAAHILALRQEKEHLLYHLSHTPTQPTPTVHQKKGVSKSTGRPKVIGSPEELQQLRMTVTRQDNTIAALRQEINALRSKTGCVILPGQQPQLPAQLCTSSPPTTQRPWSQDSHSHRDLDSTETKLSDKTSHPLPEPEFTEATDDEHGVTEGGVDVESIVEICDEDSDTSMLSDVSDT